MSTILDNAIREAARAAAFEILAPVHAALERVLFPKERVKRKPYSAEVEVLCKQTGCDRPARAKGLCSGHYQKALRYEKRKASAERAKIHKGPRQ